MKRLASTLLAPFADRQNESHEPEAPGWSTDSGSLPSSFLTLRVHDAFAADIALRNARIVVETFDGVVQLSGTVRAHYELQRAVQLAVAVTGVHSVRNCLQLRLRSPPRGPRGTDREQEQAE